MPFTTMPLLTHTAAVVPKSTSDPLATDISEMPSPHKHSLKALHLAREALTSCFGHGEHRHTEALRSGDRMEHTPSPAGRESDEAGADVARCSLMMRETDAPPVDEPSRLLQLVHRECPSSSSSAYGSDSSSSGSTWDTDKRRRWDRAYRLGILKNTLGKEDLFEEDERERRKLKEEKSWQDEAWREEIQELRKAMESLRAQHARSLNVDNYEQLQPKGESCASSPVMDTHQSQRACDAEDSQTKSGVNGGGDASNEPGWGFRTALCFADDTAGNLNRELLDQVIAARTRPSRAKVLRSLPREGVDTLHNTGVEQQRLAYSECLSEESGYDCDLESGYRGLGGRLMEKRRLKASSGGVVRNINRWRRGRWGNS
jgi:hypothetical protein